MDRDQIHDKRDAFKGKVRDKWGKPTDDHPDVIASKSEQLLGRLKERYGLKKKAAEKLLNSWMN
jgi:uncharacterized protein YjbJ (UPF0337 family)